MREYYDPSDADGAFNATTPPVDIIPIQQLAAETEAIIREAVASDRLIELHWPGDMVEDADGHPVGMTLNRIIHPGEAAPVAGDWTFETGDEQSDPWV